MMRRSVPVEKTFAVWRKDPAYVVAYDALAEEFALADALIKARSRADMTQEDVAQKMDTTQAVIARLESGRVMPSTRTLLRFAEAKARVCGSDLRRGKAWSSPPRCGSPRPA